MVFTASITSHSTLDYQPGLARREPKPPSHLQLWRVMWPARKGLGTAVKWPFYIPTPNIAELCPRQLVLGVISLWRQSLKLLICTGYLPRQGRLSTQ